MTTPKPVSFPPPDPSLPPVNWAALEAAGWTVGRRHAQHANASGETALMIAAEYVPSEIGALLAHGADPRCADHGGTTVLMHAAASCDADVSRASVVYLPRFLERGAAVSAADSDGWTALLYAASSGNAAWVAALLAEGAHVNHQGHSGYTALSLVAQTGKPAAFAAVVPLLLDAGADPDARDAQGHLAEDKAAEQQARAEFVEVVGRWRAERAQAALSVTLAGVEDPPPTRRRF